MIRNRGVLAFAAGVVISLAVGWAVFPRLLYRQVTQPLQFSHKVHTGEDVGMSCEGCHLIDREHRFSLIPSVSLCAECHSEPIGESPAELELVRYVQEGREIPWLVYSRQPDHVYFSHAVHVNRAGLACEGCHGQHGTSAALPAFEENRLTGYSRLIWGHSIARVGLQSWEGKKMQDCSGCHRERGVVESCMDCHK